MKKILIEKYANNNNFSNEKLIKRSYKPLNIIKCIKYDKKVKSYYIIINFFSIFIFIFIYYLYYLSLEKCLNGHIRCSKSTKWIEKKLNEGLLCSVLSLILIELMILNIISKLHLIHMILLLASFLIYSHNLLNII